MKRSSSPAVTCPHCAHTFVPAPDPDLEGWRRRTGRELWNASASEGGWYRRVRDFVAIVRPRKKVWTKVTEFWEWHVCAVDVDLEVIGHALGDQPTKVLAQKRALALARELVAAQAAGRVVLGWPTCIDGRTRKKDARGIHLCIDCARRERDLAAEEERSRNAWIAKRAAERAAQGRPKLRLLP